MNIYQDISEFAKTLLLDKGFFSYIENQGNYFIADVLNTISDTRAAKYNNYMVEQELLHSIMLEEVTKINNDLKDKVILLKGLQLDEEFYKPQNIMRFYEDIDLLCACNDGKTVVSYLLNNGYSLIHSNLLLYNKYIMYKFFNKLYLLLNHHLEFSKIINGIAIKIEVHFNINFNYKTKLPIKQMLSKKQKSSFWYELSTFDYFEYLITHACTHLKYFCNNREDNYMNLQTIFEVFLYFEKYKEIIIDNIQVLDKHDTRKYFDYFVLLSKKIDTSNLKSEEIITQKIKAISSLNATDLVLGKF